VNAQQRTRWIVEKAGDLGFDLCGVAPAQATPELAHLEEWLARGYAGEMRYLHDLRRRDPRHVVEGARSIIVCALDYNTPLPYSTQATWAQQAAPLRDTNGPCGWISRYAWGDDYHDIVGAKLDALLAAMRTQFPQPFDARAYVDTGPVVERVAAKHAGLGWLGKNTCLINEDLGSWLFLGVIITTLELEPSVDPAGGPPPDLCGNCRLCIEACPTGAIVEPYLLDARRCISYLTIALRGPIPEELRAPMGRHIFGCDICQDVCPFNRHAPVTQIGAFHPRGIEARSRNIGTKLETREEAPVAPAFRPAEAILPLTTRHTLFAPALDWLALISEEEFRAVFRGSPVQRTKWRGLVRNACVALGNALRLSVNAPPAPPVNSAGVGQAFLPVQKPTGPDADDQTTRKPGPRERVLALLSRLAQSPDAIIAEHATWASRKL
jgi:epoxyqueuosine reductase